MSDRVMISHELFRLLCAYHLDLCADEEREDIRRYIETELESKLRKLVENDLYSKSKAAPTDADRAAARREYLRRRTERGGDV